MAAEGPRVSVSETQLSLLVRSEAVVQTLEARRAVDRSSLHTRG